MGEEKPVESTEEKEEEEKPAESTEDEEKEEEEKPAESTEDEEEEEEEKPEESTKEEEKKEDEKEKPAESTKEEEKKEEHKEKPAESTEEEEKKEEEKEKPAESTEEEEKKEGLHVPRVGCGGNIAEETAEGSSGNITEETAEGKEGGCSGNKAEETAEGKEGEEEADELQYVKFGSREDVNFDTSVCKKYTVGPEMNADMIKAEEWFSKFTEQCHNGSIAENVYDDINDSTSTATDAKENGGQIEFFVGDEAVSLESLEKEAEDEEEAEDTEPVEAFVGCKIKVDDGSEEFYCLKGDSKCFGNCGGDKKTEE